jgi:cobalt-zinc-cadmium efflux system protein
MSHHSHTHHKEFSYSILLNFIFVIVEAYYGFYANSMSLVADAWHNLGDVLGLVFAFGASLLHAKPANGRFSYGFKRTTIMASLMNALFLVATSAIIGYESILKLMQPEMIKETTVIWVALIGVVINGGTALLFLRSQKEDLNIKGAFLHLLGDALISIGVVVTGIFIYFTHIYWIDGLGGVIIVVLIMIGTWSLLKESIILILDAVPSKTNQQKIKEYLDNIPGVTAIHDLHIWALSTKEIALTAHLVMPENPLTDKDFSKINHELEHLYHINHVTIQIEQGLIEHPCEQAC